ncbi:MAG: hypothetical protein Q4G62_10595, partial [Pseudomonadota bacterium]|nr:hypothetical protein [Pseudomonadota bacterium]
MVNQNSLPFPEPDKPAQTDTPSKTPSTAPNHGADAAEAMPDAVADELRAEASDTGLGLPL